MALTMDGLEHPKHGSEAEAEAEAQAQGGGASHGGTAHVAYGEVTFPLLDGVVLMAFDADALQRTASAHSYRQSSTGVLPSWSASASSASALQELQLHSG